MSRKKKIEKIVDDEWLDQRISAQKQLDKENDKTPGPDNGDVMILAEERRAFVKLFKMTADGRHHAALRFQLSKDGKRVLDGEPEVVGYRPASVIEHLSWLKDRPKRFVKDEIERLTGVRPRGGLFEALKSYLAAIYQWDLIKKAAAEEVDGAEAKLEPFRARVEKQRFLADVPGLTESEFYIHANGELTGADKAFLMQHHNHDEEDEMDDATKELKDRAAAGGAGEEQSEVARMKAEAKAKKAGKGEPVADKKDKAEKAEKSEKKSAAKPAAKKEAKKSEKKPKAEKRKPVDWQKLKKDMKVKYVGKNKSFAGKLVKVVSATKEYATVLFGEKPQGCSLSSLELV